MLHVDRIRSLQRLLREVDLSPVQASYVDLVRRLRMAGIKISDRRAVKLQRMMAASALLCGRRQAITSDMWVLRHIWDTDEQQEVIAAQVDNAITSAGGADQPGSHPRANRTDAPNPEVLGSELRRISARLDDPALDSAEKSQLRDELSLLAARCEWVANAHQREFLQQEVQSLWPRV
jgi:MoxR-like ATPase